MVTTPKQKGNNSPTQQEAQYAPNVTTIDRRSTSCLNILQRREEKPEHLTLGIPNHTKTKKHLATFTLGDGSQRHCSMMTSCECRASPSSHATTQANISINLLRLSFSLPETR
uniref:Uncharacterized protein n=1 Tax=Grammatophora oceanica TaxID=210454 RepID=A0A7S1VAM9_9STRA|mmetsp:Transcript_41362/g.61221  ORF Transcript_41362/g.61221 Transcript_41362/m.61221 type:complete len:113 (+) Transcript_41362:188-526(+)